VFEEFEKQIEMVLEIDNIDDKFELCGLDSIARAEVITLAEECFSIMLTNKDILGLTTYGELKKLVKERHQ